MILHREGAYFFGRQEITGGSYCSTSGIAPRCIRHVVSSATSAIVDARSGFSKGA